ncbi:ATP-binding protein [Aquimarina longa]|uniref:ATP-binding protein n=1 Tax=Aquimarina longa TaxID=1080221 RepID=UPI00078273DD|nr:ATP-binding protein [Aquimarina longa]
MVRISWFKSEAIRYSIYGIIFGLTFPILATIIDLFRLDLQFSWQSIQSVQNDYPIHYIIDTAPLFLGLFAMFGGRNLDKLKEKNKQILKTSKFKEDFLANMSHEIRTPMVGVIGMIDLLLKNTKLNDLQKEYTTIIHQSSLNLLEILNEVLDLSKIEAGKFNLSPSPINLKDIISQNINLFLATATAKKIKLSATYSNDLPENIIADGNRLTQIMSNLIGNAIKFTDTGKIHIHTSSSYQKNDELIIKIEVIDSGIGISKMDQEKLFNRFSQFHEASIIAGKGSGLGLSISKKLVNLMQGELNVTSELGKGSTFWFTFKTKKYNKVIIKNNPRFSNIKNHNYKLHILLVEDSDINILVSKQILKHLGCTIDIAKNGKQALQMFKEDTYDLILMDINLPELDGIQTSNLIRQNHIKIPPIIALTSNTRVNDVERYINQGLDDYIAKPFTIEILSSKLKNWFGNHQEEH